MTLPEHIGVAARQGDLETIRAYFDDDSDGARDVDDVCESSPGSTPLMACAYCHPDRLTLRNVEVARYLLSRGASVDKKKTTTGSTALILACFTSFGTVAEMIQLLLSAGADPNARNEHERTPLGTHLTYAEPPSVECLTALLRAGASLDRCYREHSFEWHFSNLMDGESESMPAIRALAAGVRRNGSLKRYLREPHREVLLLRGLAMRGHLVPRRRTRCAAEWTAAAAFLARLGDNGVVWNVLSFWRATN